MSINPSYNPLAELSARASSSVLNAISGASQKTGIDFNYLLQQADVESSLNPSAKANTSSASGLFQFIESTWLSMVEKHGAKYGLNEEASSIINGKVHDPQTRQDILDLRFDPQASSHMAAEFAEENQKILESHWGGAVGSTELYLSHFLGAGSASAFLNARDENPMQNAAALFPKAAKSNPNIFYDHQSGAAKSLEEVYARFDSKFIEAPSAIPVQSDIFVAKAAPAMRQSYAPVNISNLVHSPVELMLLADLELPFAKKDKSYSHSKQ